MTRQQIRSALDRVLRTSTTERILRELQSSIMRRRNGGQLNPVRYLFRRTPSGNVIGTVFRQLRTAAEKSSNRR